MALSANLKSVSDTIISLHRETFMESPSPMKIQKLCYYAQGYSLAEGRGELFSEEFQAWQHGPVIPELWQEYRQFSWHSIAGEFTVDEGLREFLGNIVLSYGRYDGAALSTMTHREAPWLDARKGIDEMAGSNNVITKESLQQFFTSKLSHG